MADRCTDQHQRLAKDMRRKEAPPEIMQKYGSGVEGYRYGYYGPRYGYYPYRYGYRGYGRYYNPLMYRYGYGRPPPYWSYGYW